ncbi:MAG TPA: ATP-binding protein [Gemmatimonadaceae bacterium]|nr:ATP-binding protein [Gemmatimonadaceae bacterium]
MNDQSGDVTRPLTNGAGSEPPLSGAGQDGHANAPADANRRRESDTFLEYARQSPLALAVTEGGTHLLHWANPAFRQLTGTTDVLLHGHPIVEAIPDSMPNGLLAVLDQVYGTGEARSEVHLEHPRAMHGPAWWSYTIWPTVHQSGPPEGLVIQMRDVTREHREHNDAQAMVGQMRAMNEHLLIASVREEERAAQAETAAQRARFLADASAVLASSLDLHIILQSLADLAVPLLADWFIVHLTAEEGDVRRVANACADQHEAERAHELERCVQLRSMMDRVLERGEPVLLPAITPLEPGGSDAAYRKPGSELTPKSAMVVPLVSQRRTIGAITLIISHSGRHYGEGDLVLAEALAVHAALAISSSRLYEAEAASQAKSRFLATMSHELRTPLTAILGYEELLVDGLSGPVTEVQRQHLGRIKRAAAHLLELIEEILTLSRIEAGHAVVRRQPVDVAPLLDAVRTLVAPQADAKHLMLTVQGPERPLTLETDAAKLRQILVNLLGNAIKFTKKGEITLSVRIANGTTAFVVHDTGIGILPEHLERIFEAFWQAEQSATRTAGGTGLGLSVTRHLARMLGGDITVESARGEGSTFTLTLPLESGDEG